MEDPVNALVVKVLDICDECIDTMHRFVSTISIHTQTGDTECEGCGTQSRLSQGELLDILMNLED